MAVALAKARQELEPSCLGDIVTVASIAAHAAAGSEDAADARDFMLALHATVAAQLRLGLDAIQKLASATVQATPAISTSSEGDFPRLAPQTPAAGTPSKASSPSVFARLTKRAAPDT